MTPNSRIRLLTVLFLAVLHLAASLALLLGGIALGGGLMPEERPTAVRGLLADTCFQAFRGLAFPVLLAGQLIGPRLTSDWVEWPAFVANSLLFGLVGAWILFRWGPEPLRRLAERSEGLPKRGPSAP